MESSNGLPMPGIEKKELVQNLYESIKDYYIQANEIYEQHQIVYFTVFAIFVAALIFILQSSSSWQNTALFLCFTSQVIFGSIYSTSAMWFANKKLDLAARIDLFSLQWINECHSNESLKPFLLCQTMWKHNFPLQDNNKKVKFFGYLSNLIRHNPKELLIAIINCVCFGMGIKYCFLSIQSIKLTNVSLAFICIVPSLAYFVFHVFWSHKQESVVIRSNANTYEYIMQNKINTEGESLNYLGGDSIIPIK